MYKYRNGVLVMKIVTITLNPAYDIHYFTDSLILHKENYTLLMFPFVWHEFPAVHGTFTVATAQSFTQFGEFQGIFVRPLGVHNRYPLAR